MDNKFSSKQTAVKTGLSVHTLRYYEKIGLVPTIERDENGYRRYSDSDIWMLEMIGYLRVIGVPIREMQQFLTSQKGWDSTVAARREFMETYREKVVDQKKEIEKALKKLDDKINLLKDLEFSEQR